MLEGAVKFLDRICGLCRRIRLDPDKPVPPPAPDFLNRFVRLIVPNYVDWLVRHTKNRYGRTLKRIRGKVKASEPLRVLFVVDMPAKWKAQSLYDKMLCSKGYTPVVGVSKPQHIAGFTPREIAARQKEVMDWFSDRGCRVVSIYDAFKDRFIDLRTVRPDIVIYQESWYSCIEHHPSKVSRFALAIYIPYFVPNYVDVKLDCQKEIHRFYWLYVVLNNEVAEIYRNATMDRFMAGTFEGLGHTILDQIHDIPIHRNGKPIVIYAPHWTFEHPNNQCPVKYSTFAETGLKILGWAKKNRQYHWVFKPHPNLKARLITSGLMSEGEVQEYYNAWGEIGEIHMGGDYIPLFEQSIAIITDCGSFLSEYGATGNPVIHLISRRNKLVPPLLLAQAYETYYQAHNIEEMYKWFGVVLEQGKDPKRAERLSAVRKAGLLGGNAAKCIVEYLETTFSA